KERAAALLRELADFHKEKKNTNGRLYNELEALKLCKQEYGRDSYIEELEKLARVSPADWYTGEVLLELARFYREQAEREDKDGFKARKIWYDKTLALIRNIEKDYAKTYAANEAARIRQQVHAKDFSVRIESYIPSGQSNPLSVTHKNL